MATEISANRRDRGLLAWNGWWLVAKTNFHFETWNMLQGCLYLSGVKAQSLKTTWSATGKNNHERFERLGRK